MGHTIVYEKQRLTGLLKIASYGLFGNLVFPFIAFIVLASHLDLKILSAWLLIILSYNLLRVVFIRKYYLKLKKDEDINLSSLDLEFFTLAVFSAIIWSSIAFIPGSENTKQFITDIQIILGVATIAAIGTLFLSPKSSVSFVCITGISFIIKLFFTGDYNYRFISIQILLFTIAMVMLSFYLYKTQMDFIRIAGENSGLLDQLTTKNKEIENLNKNLKNRLEDERLISNGMQDVLDFQSRVMESSLSGLFVIDEKGNILQVNEVAVKILGLQKGDIFGKPIDPLFSNASKSIKNLLKENGNIKAMESSIKRKDGSIVDVVINASPLKKGGKISGAVLVMDDITDKNKAARMRSIRVETLEMVTKDLPLDEILTYILNGVQELNPDFYGSFIVTNYETPKVDTIISPGIPKSHHKKIISETEKEKLQPFARAIKSKKPVLVKNIEKENISEEYRNILKKLNIKSILSLPILNTDNGLLGVFDIYSQKSSLSSNMQNIREFVQLLGISIERKRIEKELKIKNKSLSSLFQISSAVLEEIELKKLFEKTSTLLKGINEIEDIIGIKIFLPKNENLELFYNSENNDDNVEYCKSVKSGECLCGKTFKTGEVIFSENSMSDPRYDKIELKSRSRSHVIIPLIGKEKISGVLCLYTRSTPNRSYENEKELFLSIGRQIGLALENASLYEELKNMSLYDSLTGLANRHQMNLSIQKLTSTAKRKKTPLTIAYMDIDHFKEYNDTYGHAMGDDLLVQISAIIRSTIRQEDLAVRYGGEEFLLIFSETDVDMAGRIVERIRNEVEKSTRVSISAGLSAYQHNYSFDEILEFADKALYQAKRTGRNKVIRSDSLDSI